MKIRNFFDDLIQKYSQNILIRRMFAVLGIDILVKLSGIILLPVYLRLMSQEEYGLYAYLISIILTFSLVLNFGLYIPLSKFYHDYQTSNDKGKLLFTLFTLLGGILVCTLFPFYYLRLDYQLVNILFRNAFNYEGYRVIVLLSVIVSVCNFMLTNFFFISERINHVKKYNVWRIILINGSSMLLLFYFSTADAVKLRLEATYISELVVFLGFSFFLIKEVVFHFDKKLVRRSLKLGLPVMLSSGFGIVINFSDKFFLEKYVSLADLSTYYLAASCASVIPLIFTSFQNAWLPLFLKEKDLQRNVAKTKKLMPQLALVFVVISVLIYLFVVGLFLLNIFTHKYYQTIFVLPILLITQIIAALVPLYTNYLVYFEKTHIASFTGIVISFAAIGLSLLLIPRYGLYGAALVSLTCNICYFVIYYFIIKFFTRSYSLLRA